MKTIWNEMNIRNEIKRLDLRTGLEASKLPISFMDSKRVIGLYSTAGNGCFKFSNYYFKDHSWPVEEALDVIRHEYAHYMDHKLYKKLGHGSTWKKCCIAVGALPEKYYNEKLAQYYQNKHDQMASLLSDFSSYGIGDSIIHPKYGTGVIDNIFGEGLNCRAIVLFKDNCVKKLGLAWIVENCKRIAFNSYTSIN